jgi:hypothetical protein
MLRIITSANNWKILKTVVLFAGFKSPLNITDGSDDAKPVRLPPRKNVEYDLMIGIWQVPEKENTNMK